VIGTVAPSIGARVTIAAPQDIYDRNALIQAHVLNAIAGKVPGHEVSDYPHR
jgi:hypothetical protein